MPTVATIDVSLVAKAGRFVKGIDKAKRAVTSLVRKVPGLNAAFSKTGAIIGGLAAGGLVVWANRTAKAIDANAKLADRIGITTEALVGLQHAADQTGAGAGLLNNSLGAMTKRIGEAAQGFGSGKKALDALGMSAEELIGLPIEEQLARISERYKGLNTQQEKAAVAAGLFSRAGLALGNMLETGREGLVSYREEVDRLGLSYTRVDAAKVEAANDALDRAGKVIQGALQTAVIKLAPYIEAVADGFADWASEGEGVGVKVLRVLEWIIGAVAKLVDVWNILRGAVQTAGGFIIEVQTKIYQGLVWMLDKILEAVDLLTLGLSGLDDELDSTIELLGHMSDEAAKLKDQGAEILEKGWSGAASKEAKAFFDSIERKADEAGEKIAAAAEETRNGARAAAEQAQELEKVNEALEEEEDRLKRIEEDRAKELERLAAKVQTQERILGMSKEERRWSSEILEIEKARAMGLDEVAEKLQRILDRKAEEELATQRLLELERQREEETRKMEERARIAEAKRQGEREYMEELVRQLRLQEAGNDLERERLTLQMERADALERAGDNAVNRALVERFYDGKLKELEEARLKTARETAKAIGDQADQTKRVADEAGKARDAQGAGQRQIGGFVAAGSSGMFGMTGTPSRLRAFGAVNVKPVRNMAKRRKRERVTIDPFLEGGGAADVAAGATGGDGAGSLPDVGPEVDKAGKAADDMAEAFGKMADDVKGLADDVAGAFQEVDTTTHKTSTVLQSTATKVKRVEERQDRLQDALDAIKAQLSGSP